MILFFKDHKLHELNLRQITREVIPVVALHLWKYCITKVTSVKSRGVLKSLVCSCSYFEFHISLYFFLSFSLFIYYFRKVYYVS